MGEPKLAGSRVAERRVTLNFRDNEEPDPWHKTLAQFNRTRLQPLQASDWRRDVERDAALRLREGEWVERERGALAGRAGEVPSDADAFLRWFEALTNTGPGQGDALFPYLAERASLSEMRWFVTQEMAGEAGFDDLVALTQIKLPAQAKLELARNYWDEMGRGKAAAMHGPMLDRIAAALDAHPTIETTVWESLALGNMMIALAANRRYAFQSLGALGVIEMTAPTRVAFVERGLARLGVEPRARQYYKIHATLDVKHSTAWNREVIHSLVAAHPTVAAPIAEGALLRLACGLRCYERYRREFGWDKFGNKSEL